MCAALIRSRRTRSSAARPAREFAPIVPPVSPAHGRDPLPLVEQDLVDVLQVDLVLAVVAADQRAARGRGRRAGRRSSSSRPRGSGARRAWRRPARGSRRAGRPRGSRGRSRRVRPSRRSARTRRSSCGRWVRRRARTSSGRTGSKSPFATSTSAARPTARSASRTACPVPSCSACSTKTGFGVIPHEETASRTSSAPWPTTITIFDGRATRAVCRTCQSSGRPATGCRTLG